MIEFTPISAHEPGTIANILTEAYASLVAGGEDIWADSENVWRQADRDAFENPDTIGASLFITCAGGDPIGLVMWDPRGSPAVGVIGHNCVIPARRGHQYGQRQIAEALRRMAERGFKKAAVSTLDHPFFAPAQQMYEACGFREIRRRPCESHPPYNSIDYEMDLSDQFKE